MATVYLADDVKHDRRVAINVLRQDLAESLGAERFHREIKIAAGGFCNSVDGSQIGRLIP